MSRTDAGINTSNYKKKRMHKDEHDTTNESKQSIMEMQFRSSENEEDEEEQKRVDDPKESGQGRRLSRVGSEMQGKPSTHDDLTSDTNQIDLSESLSSQSHRVETAQK